MKSGIQKWLSLTDSDGEDDLVAIVEKGEVNHESGGEEEDRRPERTPPSALGDGEDAGVGVADRVAASLLRRGLVTKAQVRESELQWRRNGHKNTLWRVLAAHKEVDSETVYAEAARIYAFGRAKVVANELDTAFVTRVVQSLTTEQQDRLIALRVLPLEYEIDAERGMLRLIFATRDPMRPETLKLIHELQLDHFELRYAPESEIAPLIEELFPRQNEYLKRLQEDEDADAFDLGASYEENKAGLVDEEALDAEINRSALINLFEAALVEAVRMNASDIHIFPNWNKETEFHFRVDGQLQLWHVQDRVHPEAMLAVVKDRCGNIDRFDREVAQDGYIQRDVDEALIRYRVSILPIATANRDVKGESIVIRVLDDRKIFGDLGAIGLLPGALEKFKKAISQPHGMVIMTGPTGSGKSTTLVAALREVAKPTVNVLTVEDPVEYVIRGVRQIKLGSRLDMEKALRSILRHDPDIVMVGEMRDRPTAELAIKLANTGHLTFSTLHTNDAPSAVARLYKMGIEPFLIAYAINLVVAQRLLRKLCPSCKVVDHEPDATLLRELGFSEEEVAATTFYKPGVDEACRMCRGIGYKGRRAISEALYVSHAIRKLIVDAGDTIDEDGVRDAAVKEGMLTLVASAREVVKMGETSAEEVLRVTASE